MVRSTKKAYLLQIDIREVASGKRFSGSTTLILNPLHPTLVFIFPILFSIHFLICGQGEFV